MANPYASAGGVSTITATASGNAALNGGSGNANGANGAGGPSGAPGGNGARAPRMTSWQVTQRILGFARPYRLLLAGSLACSVASIALQLFAPILVGRAIDCMLGVGAVDAARLIGLLARLATVVVAAAALQWLQGYCMNRLSFSVVRDLRIRASDKLARVPISLIDAHPHGDLISRVVNDVDQVGDGLLQGMTQLLSGVVTIVGTCAFMLSVSVPMALIVMVVTPASALAAAAMAKFASRSFADQMAIQGRLSAHVEEYVGGQRLVSAFGYGPRACEEFSAINRELYVAGERAQFLSSLANPGTRLVNNLIYALVAAVGCVGVITGFPAALTVGGVQVFLSYATQYTKPFNEISGVVTQVQGAYASARRVLALLDAEEESDGARPEARAVTGAESAAAEVPGDAAGIPAAQDEAKAVACSRSTPADSGALPSRECADAGARGEVELRHVSFSYVPGHPVLKDICLHARPGMRVALVGPTGCGKTTLINLLLRFYDADAGEVLVDGRPVEAYERADLRRRFGMVLQDSWLFSGTVAENIAYGRPDATREQVERAAARAHADAFIRTLPQGYDTVLPEDGGTLSQGQRQLLCIARVMLADPEILLLDEATSSIDTRTELQVQAAFDELMRGRTSFVVAHRLSTIEGADCILAMRDGQIIERGTHGELLAAGGLYAELHRSQFASAE